MPIPMAYKRTQLSGQQDAIPLILQEATVMEPMEYEPSGPSVRFFRQVNDTARGHAVAMIAEFVGTTMFLFFSYAAAQIGNEKIDTLRPLLVQPGPSLLQISYISAVFGVSLGVNVWIFYRVSGGMFNPAVSLALWLAGAFDWIRLACVVPMQFLGGIAAAGLVSALLPGPLQAENALSSGATIAQGIFLEMILTAELIFTIIMLAVEKSRTTFMAPLAIGLALFVAHLIGINYTGTSVNPARTLGPAVVNGNYVSEIWIFFLGPFLGALAAAGLYHLLKAMGYESANPGQDDDGMNTYRIVHSPARPVRPIRPMRPVRPTSDPDSSNGAYYNNYLHDLTSPPPTRLGPNYKF
ncbi:Aquaporin-1 [Gnomoniopsis smithogilvyi]|uniref:Aquaporin-1 n=1 Tax=Gnomoniopsis smithogilvyi TaxID=1191159 RepID=A0A9W8YX63_9PEZI|nr:Aquaporin-1 [Gnomoniopsis smithogilvyi]